ncbi:hypothetical protein AAG570_005570 [Ranatra chinensis]|uniref:BRCT domain-containing protein n=1 Tax=Ranatra chinensis TaxID=642074 RepID=A0ABD0YLE0_9HEMI
MTPYDDSQAPNTTAEDPIKEFTMYFIYSSPSDQDDSDMLQAFKTCENSNLKPEWIREKDVRHLPMKPTTVFVLKEFKGSSFEFLSSKDCLVCGPRCVYECVSKKLPVPENQSPVFNTAMLGVVLTTTQVEKQKKDEIRKLVGYMGGSYTPNLCMAVTHLVADRGMSPKCEKAAEISIPIMTSSWVTAVWEESLLSPGVSALDSKFDSHRTPVFHGLEITCSNMSREVKMEMKTLIESNGGTCSGKLVQFTTSVLVISEPEGDKYKHAQMWDIPCVGPSWVYASLKKKVALPPNDHLVKAKPKCSTPTKVSELPSFMNSTDISMVPVGDMSKCEVNDTMSSTSSVMSVKRRKKPPENSGPDYKKYFDQINMAEVGSAGLFLDGCKIYLSGFTNQEKEKLKRVLNAGGATIFMQISDRLSHVVAGNFVAADTKIISKMQPRPNVVTLEWILESMRQGCPAGVQQYLCLQPENTTAPPPSPLSHKGLELLKSDRETPDLPPPVSRKLFVKAKKTVLNASSNFDNENLTMRAVEPEPEVIKIPNTSIPVVRPDCEVQQDKEVEPVANGGEESRDITQASEVDPFFFQGLVFEMVGIPEPEQAIEAIKTARGSVISGHHGVPDYAVVPLEGTTARVNAAEVVTVLWIEDCFDQNKVVDVMYYHQPLSFKSGCQPLTGTAVCISGYVGRERTFIVYVASILGASVQESLSRKDHPNKGILKATHLVCNEPAGSKYTAAVKWGVPVISHSWLLRCAATGRLEPIELFQLSTGTNNKNTPVPDKSSASSECSMNKLSSNVVAQTPNVKVRSSMGPPAGQLAVDQLESKTPGGPQTPMNISVAPKCGVVATPAAELTLKGWGVGDASAAPDMFSPANRSERDGNDTSDEKFASANSTSASGNRSLNGGKSLVITKRKVCSSFDMYYRINQIRDLMDFI